MYHAEYPPNFLPCPVQGKCSTSYLTHNRASGLSRDFVPTCMLSISEAYAEVQQKATRRHGELEGHLDEGISRYGRHGRWRAGLWRRKRYVSLLFVSLHPSV